MDNCSLHKTQLIHDFMEEIGLGLAFFPPNMTALLQPLDLVVNGPIKNHTRTMRVKRLVAAFRQFKDGYNNVESLTKFTTGNDVIHLVCDIVVVVLPDVFVLLAKVREKFVATALV